MAMTTYNPAQVMMGGAGPKPYVKVGSNDQPTGGQVPRIDGGAGTPIDPSYNAKTTSNMPQTTLGAESVRSTGSGPFDSAYRQNLATYSGGQFQRPGGNMSFNPTDPSTFPGNPTGYGTAPLPGLPDSLISRALGGNPFSFSPPQPAATAPADDGSSGLGDIQDWLRRMREQGGGAFRGLNLQ